VISIHHPHDQLLNELLATPPAYRPQGEAPAVQATALEIEDVVKHFHKRPLPRPFWKGSSTRQPVATRAVDHVSLRMQQGEIFGLLGANGSGKSTLIRLISTLLLPDQGRIRVFGHEVQEHQRTVQRMINRVSVEASFFKKLSALENLLYAARLYDLPAAPARQAAVHILAELGLSEKRLHEPLEHMSRGMQQKVAIARGLLTSPVLLLLDEPTTGLDPRSKQDVQRFVLRMRQQHNTTVFLTTHDMDEVDRLCDRIAIIDSGRIVALDTPERLKHHVGSSNGHGRAASMEDVFLTLTGKSLDDDL
jgi:ABC-2 type transport system ATP-binding protein